jgi:26S proteasome regulatory subunit T1
MTKEENNNAANASKAGDKKPDAEKPAGKEDDKKNSGGAPLSEQDILLFKRYGKGPYADTLKKMDDDVKDLNQKISVLCGIKESDTGLSLPS